MKQGEARSVFVVATYGGGPCFGSLFELKLDGQGGDMAECGEDQEPQSPLPKPVARFIAEKLTVPILWRFCSSDPYFGSELVADVPDPSFERYDLNKDSWGCLQPFAGTYLWPRKTDPDGPAKTRTFMGNLSSYNKRQVSSITFFGWFLFQVSRPFSCDLSNYIKSSSIFTLSFPSSSSYYSSTTVLLSSWFSSLNIKPNDPPPSKAHITSKQAIKSLNHEVYTVEIKTADAVESFEKGVMILVPGCWTGNLERIMWEGNSLRHSS
ncbi:hypothetical protein M0R45_005658 [Rubus argutus]|uniref:Uncharacterized protein n=1 Tax=Rubus argutus TaxID=59490 RepID=A0AAW1YNB4_RUBAR